METQLSLDKISELLRKSANIEIKTKVKTFFDVSGFPHYENVMSNILAFFFDPTEEHALKDLWLKSLFECYNDKANSNIQLGEFEEIEREHSTDERKRLDIIISLDDTVIAIENKIYATPYNPFDMYHREILNYCNNEKQIVEILLSLNKEENQHTKYNTTFYNITYKDLIGRVKLNLGNYIIDANEKWLLFMKEILNNIENLGGTCNMNIEWQRFLKDNENSIQKFFENYQNDINNKKIWIKNLVSLLTEKIEANNLGLEIGLYDGRSSDYFSLYINVKKGNYMLALEPCVSKKDPAYLVIALWNRDNKKYDYAEELNKLKDKFADTVIVDFSNWGKTLILEKYDFEKDLTLDAVAEKLLMIVNKIA